jgi:hypothetical protein
MRPRRTPPRPAAAWLAEQVPERLIQGLERNEFYISNRGKDQRRDIFKSRYLRRRGHLFGGPGGEVPPHARFLLVFPESPENGRVAGGAGRTRTLGTSWLTILITY